MFKFLHADKMASFFKNSEKITSSRWTYVQSTCFLFIKEFMELVQIPP